MVLSSVPLCVASVPRCVGGGVSDHPTHIATFRGGDPDALVEALLSCQFCLFVARW
jgi:hypothetical protein